MNYEKKYKEALELARVAAFNGHQNLMEGIFHELKESEDERIRKELITHCRNTRCVTEEGAERIAKWIAWLENIPYTIDHEKREGFHLGYKAGLEKQGEQKITDKVESKFKVGDYIERKDGVGCHAKIIFVGGNFYGCEKLIYPEDESPFFEFMFENQDEFRVSSDFQQKPAWSEKDEKEYKYVLKFVDNILNNCGNKKDYEHCKRCYDWLKSLKQRIKKEAV